VGCFVLRRGSIEAYYRKADRLTSIEKPSAAADEMEYIAPLSIEQAEGEYAEIVRCIRFAAKAEMICEAEALRDILLACAAPALAKLQAGGGTQDIQVLVRSLMGDRSSIFDFSVNSGDITISLQSKILSATGFPLILKKGDDVLKKVNAA